MNAAAEFRRREGPRLTPIVAESVGIALQSGDLGLKRALKGGMIRVVAAALADGVPASDAQMLKPLIWDAYEKIKKGRVSV